MTRDELVEEVYRKYKPGDTIQYRPLGGREWTDDYTGSIDPIRTAFVIDHYEYRLKPKTIIYAVEVEHHVGAHDFPEVANVMLAAKDAHSIGFPTSFIQAIRNAKPLKEGEK